MANIATIDSDREAEKSPSTLPAKTDTLSEHQAAQLLRKIDYRVLPMLFVIYIMAFLDR